MLLQKKIIHRLYDWWVSFFWIRPHHLWAFKVSLSVSLVLIPTLFLELSAYGLTLAMGVIAMALSETETHPKARLKSFSITLCSFFIATSVTEIIYPTHQLLFTLWITIGFFFILLLGGIQAKWQSISFGTVLISIYAMIGAKMFNQWFYQPLLLTSGAFCYGFLSWLFLSFRPTRLLEEQLSIAFYRLSEYLEMKSKLFPSETEEQQQQRNELAQKNVEVVQQIERYRLELSQYFSQLNAKEAQTISWMYYHCELLEELHERAASSHERYDVLSNQTSHPELIEGFGLFMAEIAKALNKYASTLLSGTFYKQPIALKWTSSALSNLLYSYSDDNQYNALKLLYSNLKRIEQVLMQLSKNTTTQNILLKFDKKETYYTSLSKIWNYRHPRFRFAVRMCIAFFIGYTLMLFLEIQNGEWIILTSLLVNQQTYSATRIRFWNRVIGTFVGVILGAIISNLLPTKWGQTVLFISSVYAFFYWLRLRYTTAVIFITVFVMSAFNIQSEQGLAVLLPRLLDTLIGAILSFLTVRFLWVDWQYKQLPKLTMKALEANMNYWKHIITKKKVNFYRSQAHIADNALTTAWKNMTIEPRKKRISQKTAYNLTFLNHALLSYMSAFNIQKNIQLSEEEYQICQTITQILTLAHQCLPNPKKLTNDTLSHYRKIEEELLQHKLKRENPKMILLHNITRISVDLLTEISQSEIGKYK